MIGYVREWKEERKSIFHFSSLQISPMLLYRLQGILPMTSFLGTFI
jgi:hypothetical protein